MSEVDQPPGDEPSSSGNIEEKQHMKAEPSTDGAKPKRVVSTIEFPYYGLESCLELVQKIHEKAGRSAATPDQVAAWLNSTVTSGTYKLRMSASRMFGLIGGERGAVRITDLAARAIDPTTAGQARAEAFLQVGLYRKVFEENRGRLLSKAAGLEAEMVTLGVSPNQKDKARQIFERSAREAGFFTSGAGRLVEPTFNGPSASAIIPEAPEGEPEPAKPAASTGKSKVMAVADDPLVQGLLSRMPPPEKGWPAPERARWLQTFAMNLELIYGPSAGAITVAQTPPDKFDEMFGETSP